VIGIGLFAYAEIVINSALPEYNYANYTGFRFPFWYNLITIWLIILGVWLMLQKSKTKQTPS